MDADSVANQLFPGGAPDPNSDINLAPVPEQDEPRFTGTTATAIIVGSAYGWETVSTISLCLIVLGAGLSVGRATGSRFRRIGVILTIGGLLWMVYLAYDIWARYKTGFQLDHLRFGMGVLLLWFLLLGLAVDRGHRKWLRLGAYSLIFAGAATAAALYLGNQCGAIENDWAAPTVLAGAFLVHSIYGWILLPVTSRLTRY